MTHRLECGVDDCSCDCWCHDRCGYVMRLADEPCHRLRGHRYDHKTRGSLEARRQRLGYSPVDVGAVQS